MRGWSTRFLSLFALVLTGFSCNSKQAASPTAAPPPSQITVSEVKAQLGEPVAVATSVARPQAKIQSYANGCSYQVEKNVVVATSCPPAAAEITLQYWRQKWQGQPQRYEKIPLTPGMKAAHRHKTYRLVSTQAKTAVIYDSFASRVVRVVRW